MKRACLSVTSLAVVVSAVGLQSSAAAPPPVSPKGRVTVITANLQEGFNTRDLQNMSELKVFATRVLHVVHSRPDVLLLQEVNSKSAHRVARLFTRKTGQKYAVVADAGDKAFRETPTKVIKSDTAIVINTGTMAKAGGSGYIVTRYKRPGSPKPEYKRNARALVSERGGTISLAMATIHVPGYRIGRRSKRIARRLQHAYPSSSRHQLEVLGGDFNQVGTHYLSYGHMATDHFWDLLTKGFHYVDSGYNVLESRSSDYVFVRRGVRGAGVDRSYDPIASRGTSSFYSDHKFRWAVVGPDRHRPTTPSGLQSTARNSGTARVKVTWNPSGDNVGIATYDVYRSTDGATFHKVAATKNPTYYDSAVQRNNPYWYRIVARDYSNNRSTRSNGLKQKA
jgi:endonuclease/exonuclease/phosphatase family metal-dependent hydrolase